ncbi:hypothetical protein [Streptomyces aureoversilis]|uniref:Uncharacterized protein n=1 Tax=Streptomyces aureoversilis TaxID=67277 RepID=A0ABV9ZS97_9ACTN
MEELLRELTAAQQLGILAGDSDGAHRTREYLVRRAAIMDRFADVDLRCDAPGDAELDAVRYAEALLGHDLLNGSTCGPIPARAECWHANPRGYARQEHRAWILIHEVHEQR